MRSAAVEERARDGAEHWDAPPPVYPLGDKVALVALIVVPALLVALVVAVLTGWWWLAAVLLLAWGAKTIADGWSADPLMLKMIGARPLGAERAPRLYNLVTGVAGDLGVTPPGLYVIDDGGPNAFIRRGGAGGVLAVTRALLDDYTRTEQEAVVAHCLVRMHDPSFVYSNLAARWSDLGAGLAPRVGTPHDVQSVALTRYPPALVTALQKADPKVKRYTPLWFAAISPSHEDTARRADAVSDL